MTIDEILEIVTDPKRVRFAPRGTGNPAILITLPEEEREVEFALVTNPYAPLLVSRRGTGESLEKLLENRSPLNIRGTKTPWVTASFSAEDILADEAVDLSPEYTEYARACYGMKDTRDIRRSYLDGISPEFAREIYLT